MNSKKAIKSQHTTDRSNEYRYIFALIGCKLITCKELAIANYTIHIGKVSSIQTWTYKGYNSTAKISFSKVNKLALLAVYPDLIIYYVNKG